MPFVTNDVTKKEEDTTWIHLPVHYKAETLMFRAVSAEIAAVIDEAILADLVRAARGDDK